MVAEKFKETLTVGSTPEECWSILTDVDRIAEWVSVVGSVTEIEHLAKYSAVLEDRLGPFSMKADLEVVVTDLQPQKSISIRADGEDRQIGSRITVDATLAIVQTDAGCQVEIQGNYEVTGRAATMGSSTIRQKAKKLLGEFTTAAHLDLG